MSEPTLPPLPIVLCVSGAALVFVVAAVYIASGVLLTVAGGIGVGLYLAAWIAYVHEQAA